MKMRVVLLITLVIAALGGTVFIVRYTGVRTRATGGPAVSHYRRLLRSPEPSVRTRAIYSLGLPGHGVPPQIEPLMRVVRADPSAEVRGAAVMALGRALLLPRGLTDVQERDAYRALLIAMVDDPSSEVRYLASHWVAVLVSDAQQCVASAGSRMVLARHILRTSGPYLETASLDADQLVRENAKSALSVLRPGSVTHRASGTASLSFENEFGQ